MEKSLVSICISTFSMSVEDRVSRPRSLLNTVQHDWGLVKLFWSFKLFSLVQKSKHIFHFKSKKSSKFYWLDKKASNQQLQLQTQLSSAVLKCSVDEELLLFLT